MEDLRPKFKEVYLEWIKTEYPTSSEQKWKIIADSYLDYFEFLSSIEDPESLRDQMEVAKQEINWHFSTKEEILLDIVSSGENGSLNNSSGFVDKSLIFLNAFKLKKKSLGFKNFQFEEKLESFGLFPHNREIENFLYKLNGSNLIKIRFSSAPKVRVTAKGLRLLRQRDITFFIKKRMYKEVIISQGLFNEFYNKSLLERELLLEEYLL